MKSFIKSLFHVHKFGKLDGNVQYCETCGLARSVNICEKSHKYKTHSEYAIQTVYGKSQRVQNLICERCGHMTQFNLTTGKYQEED